MSQLDRQDGQWAVVEYDEIDSTNAEAMRRAAAGELGPLWITAARQTAGRGRSGRGWASPQGNLAASLIFEPNCPPHNVPNLSLLAGIAVHDALSAFWPDGRVARRLRLKWPNDVLIDAAKLGGILVEATTIAGQLVVVIGIGINIRHRPVIEGRATTSLSEHAATVPDAPALLAVISARLQDWLAVWKGGADFSTILTAWHDRAGPLGEAMSINSGDGPVHGTFGGLDMEGALLLCDANGRRLRFTFGDVSLQTASKA